MSQCFAIFFVFQGLLQAQPFRILHYSETSGYDHGTRHVSFQMFEQMSTVHGFTVDHDTTGDAFNTLASLLQYTAVVFSNTSGNAILSQTQRDNFEAYMDSGGSLLGIHAASDTYRHSTANGGNTGTWDWYAELLGASVQENPNHVLGTPEYRMAHLGGHPLLANLPDPWVKHEEYYYWENGYYDTSNIALLLVEQTTGPNGLQNSYDATRPMAWYRELPQGGRVFYTALGHDVSNYTSDQEFYQHIRDALLWTSRRLTSVEESVVPSLLQISPNPAANGCSVALPQWVSGTAELRIVNLMGLDMYQERIEGRPVSGRVEVDCSRWPEGNYIILFSANKEIIVGRLTLVR